MHEFPYTAAKGDRTEFIKLQMQLRKVSSACVIFELSISVNKLMELLVNT